MRHKTLQLIVLLLSGATLSPLALPSKRTTNAESTLKSFSSAYSAYPNVPAWYATPTTKRIPPTHHPKRYHVTLREAIWLALRNNPDIKNAEAQRVLDKFSLAVAHWAFQPQFTNEFSVGYDPKTGKIEDSGQLSSTVTTPAGTVLKAGYSNSSGIFNHHNSYQVSVSQPLLKGWMQPELAYRDALDGEKMARFTYESGVMSVVGRVINQYMALLSAYNNIQIQQRQLTETLKQLHQDQLKFKKGKMARSDYLQVKVQAQQYQLDMLQQKNDYKNIYQDFLQVLGLKLDTQVEIDHTVGTQFSAVPTLQTCINTALKYNVNYQMEQISLRTAKRALKSARNQLLPDLSASAGTTFGEGKDDPNVGLSLSVPLNDLSSQQSVVEARVSLEKQRIALKQARQLVVRQITSQWNTVQSDISRIKLAQQTVALQAQTVKDNRLLLQYGRTTVFDFLRIQDQLLSQQLGLVGLKTSLVNDETALQSLMGTTLQSWHIQLRY